MCDCANTLWLFNYVVKFKFVWYAALPKLGTWTQKPTFREETEQVALAQPR